MEFTRFDETQASDNDFERAAAFLAELDAAYRPLWPSRSGPELAYALRTDTATGDFAQLWFGGDGKEKAASAFLQLPVRENTSTALIEIRVRPDLRRRGIATGFLRALISAARAEGRTRVIGPTDSHGAGEYWGATKGFRPTLRFVQQILNLAEADRGSWSVPVADGYRLQSWIDTVSEDLLASYAVARQAIEDAVSGDMQWDEPKWTSARVREEEARNAAAGRESRVVVAVEEATGEVAALTKVAIGAARPAVAQQLDTAVRREHRGRGLGLTIKAAQLRTLVAERPGVRQVMTQTADLNYMAAINRALGFQALADSVYIEAEIADVEKALGSDS